MRQTAKDRPPEILWALVNGGTGVIVIGSGGLTCSRSAAGAYPMTLQKPIGNFAVVVTAHPGTGVITANAGVLSPTGFTVATYTPNTGALIDCTFSVVVIRQPA